MNPLRAYNRAKRGLKRLFAAYAPAPLWDAAVAATTAPALVYCKPSYWLDRWRLVGPDDIYDRGFFEQHVAWREDAHAVAAAIAAREDDVESVLDLGCGVGTHLEWFHERGYEVHGVDGSEHALAEAVLPDARLERHDLREPYEPPRSFDLVCCFEVLEHVPEPYADTLVASIARSGRVAYVSAAPPGQPGEHHVNLRPPSYWIERFAAHGMRHDERAAEWLRATCSVESTDWILENLLVFRREEPR